MNCVIRETGPVDFDDQITHNLDGATQLSTNPPIWVIDGNPAVSSLIEQCQRDNTAYDVMEHPGSHVPLRRKYIDASNVEEYSTYIQHLLGIDRTPTKMSVKEYIGNNESSDVVLENPHIDRNRDEGSDNYRNPMRFTAIVSFDDHGGTVFPFAVVDSNVILPENVRSIACDVTGEPRAWPVMDNNPGLFIGGKRGRLLIFSSSNRISIPLYRSLHYGVLGAKQSTRHVSILGFDGSEFETSGQHECIDHKLWTTRAAFFNRTIEEELVGSITGPRGGEAVAALSRLAQTRNTTIQALIREGENDMQRAEAMREVTANLGVSTLPLNPPSAPVGRLPDKLHWEAACPVCMSDFMPEKNSGASEMVEPGFLRCGHVICTTCHAEMRTHGGVLVERGNVKCPICKVPSQFSKLFDHPDLYKDKCLWSSQRTKPKSGMDMIEQIRSKEAKLLATETDLDDDERNERSAVRSRPGRQTLRRQNRECPPGQVDVGGVCISQEDVDASRLVHEQMERDKELARQLQDEPETLDISDSLVSREEAIRMSAQAEWVGLHQSVPDGFMNVMGYKYPENVASAMMAHGIAFRQNPSYAMYPSAPASLPSSSAPASLPSTSAPASARYALNQRGMGDFFDVGRGTTTTYKGTMNTRAGQRRSPKRGSKRKTSRRSSSTGRNVKRTSRRSPKRKTSSSTDRNVKRTSRRSPKHKT